MAANGQAPFDVSEVSPTFFGSGGHNVVPNQGKAAMGPLFNDLLGRTHYAVANTTALTATLAKDRADGQLVVTLDTYTVWTWQIACATAASSTVIAPTDVGVGNGRWVANATTPVANASQVPVKFTVDIPLATIQGKTSTTPFNIGAALPANAQILGDPEINVIQALAGTGPMSAATATVQNTGETAGALVASTDVFSATGIITKIGSNPYPSRGGQQLQMTLTSTGGTLAAATAGHLSVTTYYSIIA